MKDQKIDKRTFKISQRPNGLAILFNAMASPCEVLIETDDFNETGRIAKLICERTWQIEDKFSRYNPLSIVSKINNSNNKPVAIDPETYRLLQFSHSCFQISGGLFDITSGILRQVWTFDGSDRIPKKSDVNRLLKSIGWQHVKWDESSITLPNNMEIDLGGIGKEYAVDVAVQLLRAETPYSALVNFGGDIAVTNQPKFDPAPQQQLHQNKTINRVKTAHPWHIAIELGDKQTSDLTTIELTTGAIATSGDANRYLVKDGQRYCHILNPKTGWPVAGGPSSVTVAAPTCIEAGIAATIAMLKGNSAKAFLTENQIQHWIY
ncbi:FAD:protein FMN transferase [Psychrosphaera sp. B3R10]|uniref:FAD:protein FMN transferase n=1 Tax=unclassified Psychrosphaera TaxID=2641570 RepID=UPI001C0A1A4A|nr:MULTISPECIES: FAD:protein FMN transferase [unclassified Psychrosphaera]MBU2880481.1 FAD:protein FMN transferase [Psychrosphaera sp. I2R16]MBU2991418.1 FAD:protein FMN transferase [Psychrosphaera sp. B3R10]